MTEAGSQHEDLKKQLEDLSSQLEALKKKREAPGQSDPQFERDKASYEQVSEHLRSLNQVLWQVPTIAITLTGGLWYGVTKMEVELARQGLLAFAALSDFLLIFVLLRVRFLFGQYLLVAMRFNPTFNIAREAGPGPLPGYTVVGCFCLLMFVGGAGSTYGVLNPRQISGSSMNDCISVQAAASRHSAIHALGALR